MTHHRNDPAELASRPALDIEHRLALMLSLIVLAAILVSLVTSAL